MKFVLTKKSPKTKFHIRFNTWKAKNVNAVQHKKVVAASQKNLDNITFTEWFI